MSLARASLRVFSTGSKMAAPKFVDIGSNLLDPMFQGQYNGKRAHSADLDHVMQRAREAGVEAQMVTSGSLKESKAVLKLVASEDDLYCTIGCHPTRVSGIDEHTGGQEAYFRDLQQLLSQHKFDRSGKGKGKAVAIGECGLDYDRLRFSSAELQRKYFARQLDLAEKIGLPLFLHSRNAHADFVSILKPRMEALQAAVGSTAVGVVHSFTGTLEEMKELVDMGLYIGLNGCSFKTEENLSMAAEVPLSRLMLETDCPWCEPRSSHASAKHIQAFKAAPENAELVKKYFPTQVKKEKWSDQEPTAVKSRSEPCNIGGIAAVVAAVQRKTLEEVAQHARQNTRDVFGI